MRRSHDPRRGVDGQPDVAAVGQVDVAVRDIDAKQHAHETLAYGMAHEPSFDVSMSQQDGAIVNDKQPIYVAGREMSVDCGDSCRRKTSLLNVPILQPRHCWNT